MLSDSKVLGSTPSVPVMYNYYEHKNKGTHIQCIDVVWKAIGVLQEPFSAGEVIEKCRPAPIWDVLAVIDYLNEIELLTEVYCSEVYSGDIPQFRRYIRS